MPYYVRLHEAIDEYLRMRSARCARTTVRNETFVLRRFNADYGDVQMRHIRPERVADWFYGPNGLCQPHVTRDRLRRGPVTATTANYYRTRLASFFRWATRRGWLKCDLLQDVEPFTTTRRTRLQAPPATLLRLLDCAYDRRDRALIAVLINTGFRAGTAIGLKVGDVDLDEETLSVVVTKSHQEDKFPITLDLAAELKDWLSQYAVDIGRPLRKDDWLLPARGRTVYRWTTDDTGTKVRSRTDWSWAPERPMTHPERAVQLALRGVGITDTKGEGCHTLRRSVARALFDSMATTTGYDAALRTVSATLHHQSSATTEHYLGLTSERSRRDAMLRGAPFLTAFTTETLDNVRPIRVSSG